MTPLEVEILMHCHSRAHNPSNMDAPAVKGVIEQFSFRKVIELRDDIWKTTDLGEAWVKIICDVKRPTVAYLDEQGDIIGEDK